MDPRTESILENCENNALGLDDSFRFKCRSCGKCCKNRDDVLLTARDLYNIAKKLGTKPLDAVKQYCDSYIGQYSRVPIVRLKFGGPANACPLLQGDRCMVHNAKPVVCAIFPLGRFAAVSKDDAEPEEIKPSYFLQPATCGSLKHTHTVRGWLEQFGIPAEDEFFPLWTRTLRFLTACFNELESRNTSERTMEMLWNAAFSSLYVDYDTATDFITQFRENSSKLQKALERVSGVMADGINN